ncbi:MAG: C10 family peptidase [Muribaculaceae bacterium]
MKTHFTLSLALLILCMPVMARQINENEALLVAKKFEAKELPQLRNLKQGSQEADMKLAFSKKDANANLFYVFNRGENQGFLIISGDDRAHSILGYSETGTFDYEKIPSNMKVWLDGYAKEIKTLIANPNIATTITTNIDTKEYAQSIAPLLGTTAWNQLSPYNNLCPVMPGSKEHAASGCVATATAQAMYYNQWPPKGKGNHTYTSRTQKFTLSADFNTTYDWAAMTPTYNSSSSQASNDAVAKLMYHCGVSVDMDYGRSSGAQSTNVPYALYNYFDYDKGMRYLMRKFYGFEEWMSLMKNELNSNRVIIYGGNSAIGGHQFLFDGYDKNNLFHVNWGWGGTSNGYFQINALTPSSQGVGGSNGGFNYDQDAIIGVQKATSTSIIHNDICSEKSLVPSNSSITRDGSTTITLYDFFSYSWNSFNANLALGLYDQTNNLVTTLKVTSPLNFKPYYGYGDFTFKSIKIPASVANGNYKIYALFKSNTDTDWSKIKIAISEAQYVNVNVTSSNVDFTVPSTTPNLSATNIAVINNIYNSLAGKVSCTITNNGNEYFGAVNLVICKSNDGSDATKFNDNIIDLLKGESTSLTITEVFNLAPGDYYLNIIDNTNQIIGEWTNITILPKPGNPVFALTATPSFKDNNNVPKNNMQLTAKIRNDGGYYFGSFYAFIYPEKGGQNIAYIESLPVAIDNNTTAEVVFEGNTDIANGRYFAVIYRIISNRNEQIEPANLNKVFFTLGEPLGVNEITIANAIIYPNPATNNVTITSDKEITAIRIYDLAGALKLSKDISQQESSKIDVDITTLAKGCYLVQIMGTNSIDVKQLIKK